MTALVWLLGGGLVLATGAVVTFAMLGRRDAARLLDLADLLDGQRKLVAEYKSKHEVELVAHTVTAARLKTEQNLRAVAEAQRNEGMRKVRDLLRKHLRDATEDEIQVALADAFQTPLSLLPGNELENPFT